MISSKFKYKSIFLFWDIFNLKFKIKFIFIIFLGLASALSELFTLTSILPVLDLLENPEWNIENSGFGNILLKLGYFGFDNYLIIAIALFGILLIASSALRLFSLRLIAIFTAEIGSLLSSTAYEKILKSPYEKHINTKTSETITALSKNIDKCLLSLFASLQLIIAFIISLFITAGLALTNGSFMINIFTIISAIYLLISSQTSKILYKNSANMVKESRLAIKTLQEGLGAAREIILDDNYEFYISRYKKAEAKCRKIEASNLFISSFPRFIIEPVCLISILVFGVIFFTTDEKIDALATLGVFALGFQRLLPNIQQIYASISTIKTSKSDYSVIKEILRNPSNKKNSYSKNKSNFSKFESLEFIKINYSYNRNSSLVLKNINLNILRGQRIGIVGHTGSGKSTLIDILMGLLLPNNGLIKLNGNTIEYKNSNNSIINLNKLISHVPQDIYLLDCSIAENIAFGVNRSEIDMKLVEKCCKKACIYDFIADLPNQFETQVGERGVRLSGGQIQRIGIARALYKCKPILVLDEATSALDSLTESKIIKNINKLDKTITLIMIAHRITTLKNCTEIIRLEKGRILDQGTPEKILF